MGKNDLNNTNVDPPRRTAPTYRAQLGDLFRHRDEVEDRAKRLALEGAVQGGHDDRLAGVGQLLAEGGCSAKEGEGGCEIKGSHTKSTLPA